MPRPRGRQARPSLGAGHRSAARGAMGRAGVRRNNRRQARVFREKGGNRMTKEIAELDKHREEMGAALAEARDELDRTSGEDSLSVGNLLREISEEIEDWDKEADAHRQGTATESPHGLTERAQRIKLRLMNLRSQET